MSQDETNEQNENAQAADSDAPEQEAAEAPSQAGAVAPAEPEEQLSPKERRRRERSRHTGEARPPRSPEERARERAEERRRKAAARRAWRARRSERRSGERGPARTEPVSSESRSAPRVRQGVVVSDRADKTITVRIDVTRRHRAYKKIVRESTTLHAHDERNDAGVGDTVRVVESRPLSRSKRWRLVDVLERAR